MNKEQEWERKHAAYDLRLRGKSYRAIAAELGISVGTSHRWVQEVLDSVVLPTVEAVRKQEVDRLMRYLDKLDQRIEDGDDKAIGIALKVSERLSKMLGIDMPTQIQVEKTETTQVDLALRDLIERQKAQNALRKAEAALLRESEPVSGKSDKISGDTESDVERIVLDN